MSEPIVEQIMTNVRTRLAAYTSAYRSPKIASWQPKDLTIAIYQGDITRNEEMSCPGNPPAQAWDLLAIVAGIVKPSDDDTTPVDRYKNRFWAEIVKAATNANQWHTWGGLAYDTVIGDVRDYTSDDGSASGISVEMLIRFRTDEDDPDVGRA
jgi:hypothetical protein